MVSFSMVKVGREQNKITHGLAQLACRLTQSRVSFSVVPDCIQDLVLEDRIWVQNGRWHLIFNKDPVSQKNQSLMHIVLVSSLLRVFRWTFLLESVMSTLHRFELVHVLC